MSSHDHAQIVTMGETMGLFQTSRVGSLAHVPTAEVSIGGAESNVAIGLSRLGVSSAWIGRVGADGLGERVLRELRAEAVAVYAAVDGTRPTGLMLKSKPSATSTRVDYYRSEGSGAALNPRDIPDGVIEVANTLHITGIAGVLSPSSHDAVHEAITRAQAAGVTVSFDVNHRSALAETSQAAAVYRSMAEQADIIFGGPEELAMLSTDFPADLDTYDDDAQQPHLQALADQYTAEVVLKRGATGAAAVTAGTFHAAPGLTVQVADTVGAGDAFVAGYLAGRIQGLNPQQRLEQANACGAVVCTHPGDWEAAARPADIKRITSGSSDPVQR